MATSRTGYGQYCPISRALEVVGVLPERRCVLHIRFSDDPRRFWLLVERGEPSVCLSDPGFEIDVTIVSDLSTLYRVWLGQLPLAAARRAGDVTFHGRAPLVRRMPQVLQLSPVAATVSAARGAREVVTP